MEATTLKQKKNDLIKNIGALLTEYTEFGRVKFDIKTTGYSGRHSVVDGVDTVELEPREVTLTITINPYN